MNDAIANQTQAYLAFLKVTDEFVVRNEPLLNLQPVEDARVEQRERERERESEGERGVGKGGQGMGGTNKQTNKQTKTEFVQMRQKQKLSRLGAGSPTHDDVKREVHEEPDGQASRRESPGVQRKSLDGRIGN